MNESVFWYRYEDVQYAAPLDEFDNPMGDGRLEVVLREFLVAKETPKGVRLDSGRFVLRNARKRYACPTEAEAMKSFIARKQSQLRILKAQINHVEKALALILQQNFNYSKSYGATLYNVEYFPFTPFENAGKI